MQLNVKIAKHSTIFVSSQNNRFMNNLNFKLEEGRVKKSKIKFSKKTS